MDLPERSAFPVVRTIPTRWADNDHYGHVNNAVYYLYLDTAVNGWLIEATGTDIRDMPEIGVVVSSSCNYLTSVGFPDVLEVGPVLLTASRYSANRTGSCARGPSLSTSTWIVTPADRCPSPRSSARHSPPCLASSPPHDLVSCPG